LIRIRNRQPITSSPYDIKYQTYIDTYNSLKSEIQALRTKIGIIFGLLGAVFTIIVGYSLTTSYSVDNIIPFLQTVCNLPESVTSSLSSIIISPTKIPVVGDSLSFIVVLFVMLGIEYFWLYFELHSLKSTVCPSTHIVQNMEMIQTRPEMENLVLADVKKNVSQLSIDYKFYSAVTRGNDIFLLMFLAILFSVYVGATSDIIITSLILPVLCGAITLCEVVLSVIFLIVIYCSKDEKRKIKFIDNYTILKYLKIFLITMGTYFSCVLMVFLISLSIKFIIIPCILLIGLIVFIFIKRRK